MEIPMGIQIMLKSLGIDLSKLEPKIKEGIQIVHNIDARFQRIEQQQDAILKMLSFIPEIQEGMRKHVEEVKQLVHDTSNPN